MTERLNMEDFKEQPKKPRESDFSPETEEEIRLALLMLEAEEMRLAQNEIEKPAVKTGLQSASEALRRKASSLVALVALYPLVTSLAEHLHHKK